MKNLTNEICDKLKYQNKEKCITRINALKKGVEYFLEQASYDMVYTKEQFLEEVGKIIGYDFSEDIKKAKQNLAKKKKIENSFNPYIKVLHDYKVGNVWSGMGLVQKTTIKLDKFELFNKKLDEKIEYAKATIKNWIKENLDFKYKGFKFFYDENSFIEFDKDGNQTEVQSLDGEFKSLNLEGKNFIQRYQINFYGFKVLYCVYLENNIPKIDLVFLKDEIDISEEKLQELIRKSNFGYDKDILVTFVYQDKFLIAEVV